MHFIDVVQDLANICRTSMPRFQISASRNMDQKMKMITSSQGLLAPKAIWLRNTSNQVKDLISPSPDVWTSYELEK